MFFRRSASLWFLFFLSGFPVFGQGIEEAFEEGKSLFEKEQYALAMVKFAPLTSMESDNPLIPFASYYFAVASYYSGDTPTAKNMFLQIVQKHVGWDQMEEVRYWLAQLFFEEGNYYTAMHHLGEVNSPDYSQDIVDLKAYHFSKIEDEEVLRSLLSLYPDEKVLAGQLVKAILKQPSNTRDNVLLRELSEKYGLSYNLGLESTPVSHKKAIYNVAAFLPFSYQDDSIGFERVQTNWATRFYEGLKLGVERLAMDSIEINLLAFDTKRSQRVTTSLLQSKTLQDSIDLIIGPVFTGPVLAVSQFAKKHQINMVNPLSSNSRIIENNPFAFLYYPSNEALAIKAADYALENFIAHPNAAIFYGDSPTDRLRADIYKQRIEDSFCFQVVIFKRVSPSQSVNIQQLLLEKHDVPKDSLEIDRMEMEMDSLRKAGVRDWEIYDSQDFLVEELKVLPDSIGHIFIASDDASLSASAISAIDARPDNIAYIGSSRWLAAEQSLSFEQLERVDATFTGANLIDYEKGPVKVFWDLYEQRFHAYPKKEVRLGDAYSGYDMMAFYGKLLQAHGKYFQVGLKQEKQVKGELTEAFDYQFSNDNHYIPIYKIRNSRIRKTQD